MANGASFLNPTILGRPLFPSPKRTEDILRGVGQSIAQTFTPSAGTPPATMAGVSIPPAGASLSQLQFAGPLINTSRFNQQAAPQPAQPARQPYNYGLYAATMGLPSFDVTKTQTPFDQYSAAAPQQLSNLVANRTAPQQNQVPAQDLIFPLPADQRVQGRFPINIQGVEPMSQRSATLYTTPEQLKNFSSRTTAYEGRTPEQQAALLANIRKTGSGIASSISESAKRGAAETPTYTTPVGAPIKAPTNMYGRPIKTFADTYAAASQINEAALAGMRGGAQPTALGQPTSTGQGFGARGIGGVAMPFGTSNFSMATQPQPSTEFGFGSSNRPTQYVNTRAEQRKEIRKISDALGIERPLSRAVENQYRQEFSRRGLL